MDLTRTLPSRLADQVRAVASGRRTPVEPRDAATVVLLRGGSAGAAGSLEVYLLRRHVGMAFAAGMAVFPGGGVDPRDFEGGETHWAGPSPREWARRLGVDDEAKARALVCAAVRETFEESGVLLAGPSPTTIVEDTTAPGWEEDRRRLEARELSLTELLSRRSLTLRTDLLGAWSAWLTPVFEPRRYRTWFFVAELPRGQRTRDVSTESEEVTWLPVRDAIAAVDDGQLLMLPPQYCTCLELFDCAAPADALAASETRVPGMIEPTATVRDGAVLLEIPERLVALGDDVRRRLRS